MPTNVPELLQLVNEFIGICADNCDCNECGPCQTRQKAEEVIRKAKGEL